MKPIVKPKSEVWFNRTPGSEGPVVSSPAREAGEVD